MTIREAINKGIPRIRLARWVNPEAYLKIPLSGGVWARLFDSHSERIDIPVGSQQILIVTDTTADYVEYEGPPHDSEAVQRVLG